MNYVLDFINQFKEVKTFTNGMCYWFAHILKTRFPGSIILYDPIDNHFATLIENRIYDASGDITNTPHKWTAWNPQPDHPEDQRIIRDCILKIPIYSRTCGGCSFKDACIFWKNDSQITDKSFCGYGLK